MQPDEYTLLLIIEFNIFLRQLNQCGGDGDAELFGIQPIFILLIPFNDLLCFPNGIDYDFIAVCNINHA